LKAARTALVFPDAAALPEYHLKDLALGPFRAIVASVLLELVVHDIVEVSLGLSCEVDVDANLVLTIGPRQLLSYLHKVTARDLNHARVLCGFGTVPRQRLAGSRLSSREKRFSRLFGNITMAGPNNCTA
jgi:hypothetical protein